MKRDLFSLCLMNNEKKRAIDCRALVLLILYSHINNKSAFKWPFFRNNTNKLKNIYTHSHIHIYFYTISHTHTQFIGIPTTSCIGLIFQEKFAQMKMPAADLTLVINVNSALSMSLGLINGPLLRAFGYRKISVIAAIIFSLGLILTAFSDSISSLIINYGIITGLEFLFLFAHFFLIDRL